MAERPLTPKQARFRDEYLIDLNGAAAYVRSGYTARNMNVAAREAFRLLRNPKIAAAIAKAQAERSERTQITQDMVITELWRVAGCDISEAYDERGTLLPIHDIPEGVRHAIAGVETFEEYEGRGDDREKTGDTRKVRTWDKVRALELLGKHLGMFVEHKEITGRSGRPIEIITVDGTGEKSRARRKERALAGLAR